MPLEHPHGFRFPARQRLKTSSQFDLVYRQGKRFRGPDCSVICRSNGLDESRLGISVQKKTGNAVLRNRIKRILREAFRLHRELFPPACDVVVAVRPGFSLLTTDAVCQMVMVLDLRRARKPAA